MQPFRTNKLDHQTVRTPGTGPATCARLTQDYELVSKNTVPSACDLSRTKNIAI